MFYYVILRVLYTIYFIGAAVIVWHLVSTLIWENKTAKDHLRYTLAHLLLALIWPLAVFSRAGRQRLVLAMRKIL